MMPRPKAQATAPLPPPGPISLEFRRNERIVWRQPAYDCVIDQSNPAETVIRCFHAPREQKPPVKAAPLAEMHFEAAGEVNPKEG